MRRVNVVHIEIIAFPVRAEPVAAQEWIFAPVLDP